MKKNFLNITKNNLTAFELQKFTYFKILEKANKVNKLNIKYLKTKMSLSGKQISRLIKSYKNNSFSLFHKNKWKKNSRVKSENLNQEIVNLYKSICNQIQSFRKDQNYLINHKLFYKEYVEGKFDVKYNYVNSLLNKNFLVTKNTKRKTKRNLKKELKKITSNNSNNNIDKNSLDIINNFDFSFIDYQKEKKIPYVKHNKEFGECVEIDACVDRWFNNEKYYLYHAVDAGTGKLLAIHMEKEETNIGYAKLLESLFLNYGAPIEIRTDRRTSFWNRDGGDTNLSFCLKEFEINLKTNSEPTFKPNVERSFKNAQDIYPFIFAKMKINSLTNAQKYLNEIMNIYNEKYKRSSLNKKNQFVKISKEQIKNGLFYQKVLKVHKGFYVYFENKSLCLVNSKKQRIQMKNKIVLRKNLLTNEIFSIHNNQKYLFEEINEKLINNYLDEFSNNEYLKIEKEKQKKYSYKQKNNESNL